MHLLVVSHSCAVAVNRKIYAVICKVTGWRVTLIVPKAWNDEYGNQLNESSADYGVKVIHLPVVANGRIILHCYRSRITRLLRLLAPDLIYINHEPYALATAQCCLANLSSLKVPFGFYSCQNINKPYPPPIAWIEKLVYQNSQFAFPITDAVADVIRQKNFKGLNSVCPLPIDTDMFNPDHKRYLPNSLASRGCVVLGFVGRLVESKGLKTLALALSKIIDLPWRLVVLGTGDYKTQFEQLLDRGGVLSRVEFMGYIPHAESSRWLAAMDVLVLPSETQRNWKEQFGRVIPEAFACGASVVGSSSGEIPNLIRQSGGGLIFPERDPDALAYSLTQMILNPDLRDQCVSSSLAWVSENISLDAVAKRMVCAFEEVLK